MNTKNKSDVQELTIYARHNIVKGNKLLTQFEVSEVYGDCAYNRGSYYTEGHDASYTECIRAFERQDSNIPERVLN